MAIVIVDDDENVRALTRRMLEGAGMDVLGEAADGAEALALVSALKPALVVMDGRMPVMDGTTATRRLLELHPDVAVIAHTSDPKLGDDMSEAGASGVVLKGSQASLVRVVRASLTQVSGGGRRADEKSTIGAVRLRAALLRYAEFHPEAFLSEDVAGEENEGWWLNDGSLAFRLTAIHRVAVKEGLGEWMELLLELRQRGEIVGGEAGVTRTINGVLVVVLSPL